MQARIYQDGKSPTQSGTGTKKWILDFIHDHMEIDPTMGWSSSKETLPQVKMYFDTQEEASHFALERGWSFEIIASNPQKIVKKTYADNFVD